MACCNIVEHWFHSEMPEHPCPGDRCCCGALVINDDCVPEKAPLRMADPGKCSRCNKPFDSFGHEYKDGTWYCYNVMPK